jgi:hypothetical protein
MTAYKVASLKSMIEEKFSDDEELCTEYILPAAAAASVPFGLVIKCMYDTEMILIAFKAYLDALKRQGVHDACEFHHELVALRTFNRYSFCDVNAGRTSEYIARLKHIMHIEAPFKCIKCYKEFTDERIAISWEKGDFIDAAIDYSIESNPLLWLKHANGLFCAGCWRIYSKELYDTFVDKSYGRIEFISYDSTPCDMDGRMPHLIKDYHRENACFYPKDPVKLHIALRSVLKSPALTRQFAGEHWCDIWHASKSLEHKDLPASRVISTDTVLNKYDDFVIAQFELVVSQWTKIIRERKRERDGDDEHSTKRQKT